jgi:hypothetical protein
LLLQELLARRHRPIMTGTVHRTSGVHAAGTGKSLSGQ